MTIVIIYNLHKYPNDLHNYPNALHNYPNDLPES